MIPPKPYVDWTCPRCGKTEQVTYYPGCPAKTYGPSERCYPAEDAEMEPEFCEDCEFEIPMDDIEDLIVDKYEGPA